VVKGYIPRAAPPTAPQFMASQQPSQRNAITSVDLRPYMTQVENQGKVGSCTANAAAGAYEYLVKRHLGYDAFEASRLFIYYNARYLDNQATGTKKIEDTGSSIGAAIESLKKWGACPESLWIYEPNLANTQPPAVAYNKGGSFLIDSFCHLPISLQTWKNALIEGHPIVFGTRLFDSFTQQRVKGLIPMPTEKDISRSEHGLHAMLCVGFSDAQQVFIVRNSWGETFGDKGYCYMPYDYLMNPKYNLNDSWLIKKLATLPEAHLQNANEAVYQNDADTELANMEAQKHQEMLDAMGDYTLEYRIALLAYRAVCSDSDISIAENQALTDYITSIYELVGYDLNVAGVLENCSKDLNNWDLIHESLRLMQTYLTTECLQQMKDSLLNIAKTDHLSQEEADFLHLMETSWGVSETALDEVTVAEVQNEMLPEEEQCEVPLEEELSEVPSEEEQSEVPSEEESNRQMVAAMGDYPLEYRISLLAYKAVCADGYLTTAEKQAVTNYVNAICNSMGHPSAAAAILEDCWNHLNNLDLIDESIQLMQQFLSHETLQQLKDDFLNMAKINKWMDGEVDFIHHLEAVWEVE
jgi:C1A family cysteine protease